MAALAAENSEARATGHANSAQHFSIARAREWTSARDRVGFLTSCRGNLQAGIHLAPLAGESLRMVWLPLSET